MRVDLVTATAVLMVAATVALGLADTAMAQNSVPTEIGNRANGLNYQPTPSEVLPREKAAGLLPSAGQRDATSQELENMDRDLLREEGLSTKSVPNLASPPQ
jgi:hypothetical protein